MCARVLPAEGAIIGDIAIAGVGLGCRVVRVCIWFGHQQPILVGH